MLSHGVIFNLGSAKVCSPVMIEAMRPHISLMTKIYGML